MSENPITGGCQCGAVRYSIETDDFGTIERLVEIPR